MKTHISKLTLLALCAAMLMVVPSALAQDAAAADQKDVPTSEPVANQPWYANTDGAYSVSLGTGQLISLYPPARNDQSIPNGEYVEGPQSVSLKSKDYKYQLFYGLSASSVYTNSIGNVGTGSDLVSTRSIHILLCLCRPRLAVTCCSTLPSSTPMTLRTVVRRLITQLH